MKRNYTFQSMIEIVTRKADFSEIFSLLKKKLQPIRIENNNFYRKTSMISTNRNDFFKYLNKRVDK